MRTKRKTIHLDEAVFHELWLAYHQALAEGREVCTVQGFEFGLPYAAYTLRHLYCTYGWKPRDIPYAVNEYLTMEVVVSQEAGYGDSLYLEDLCEELP
jgi:hypothetical protein